MRQTLLLSILLIMSILFACTPKISQTISADSKKEFYGEKIESKNPISISELVEELNSSEKYLGQLQGKVTSVCQVKGCWMNVEDENGNSAFVKFKDYGFFMPLDLDGETVIMRGTGMYEVTSVEELKHYAEDEGLSKEAIEKITEPARELKFLADGVILIKE